MSDQDSFILAVQAAPQDDVVRLAYADWLEDHDQGPRAELIRAQCALAALPEEDAGRAGLEARAVDLLRRHGAFWGNGLPGKVLWRRGFPEVFEVRVGEYLRKTRALKRRAPVQAIRLYEPSEDERGDDDDGLEDDEFLRLTRCPLLERWTDLEIAPGFLGLADSWACFESLVGSPHLTRLRRLSVRSNGCLGPAVCRAADPKLAHLTHLDIFNSDSYCDGPGNEGISKIVTSPHMANLTYLDIGCCDVGDDGLRALVASPHMARLETLKTSSNFFYGAGIRAISTSGCLPRLKYLDLNSSIARHRNRTPYGDPVAALIDAPILSRLRGLDITRCGLEGPDLLRLARRTDLSGLRYLGIGEDGLSDADVRSLLASPSLAELSHLEWSGTAITDEIASVLIAAPQLTRLTVSRHYWEHADEETVHRLRDRFRVLFRAE